MKFDYKKKQNLERRHTNLWMAMQRYRNVWSELKEYVNPWIGEFTDNYYATAIKVDSEKVVKNTALRANIVQAAGMQDGITSATRPWFKIGLPFDELLEIDHVKIWVSDVEKLMYKVFAKSNFYNNSHSFYMLLGCFGCAAMLSEESMRSVVNFTTLQNGQYAIGLNSDGLPNIFTRIIHMSAPEIIDMFGEENCPYQIKAIAERDDYTTSFKVKHLIFENADYNEMRKGTKHMQYKSVYWVDQCEDGKYLRESGYREFPVFFARWEASSSHTYGTYSPGLIALPDSKSLQNMVKDIYRGVELLVDPPLNVPLSTQANGGVDTLPGGVNYYADGTTAAVHSVFEMGLDLRSARDISLDVKDDIEKAFFADLFLMLNQLDAGKMTAQEAFIRNRERMSMIGPVNERVQYEFLKPVINRVFSIMLRVPGLMPPIPEELQGIELSIEFISVLAQAQRMQSITAIEQFSSYIGNMSDLNHEVLDTVNWDKGAEYYGNAAGVPAEMLRSPDEIAKIREARAKQMKEQQQMQNNMMMLQQSSQAAANLSKVNAGGNNALDTLLGQGGV